MTHSPNIRRVVVATLVLLATAAGPSRAAETAAPPSHLAAYDLAWLNYLDPADVPATRAAVCSVDSGVAITPDTPADSPDGPILARLAVDGGAGTPEGNSAEYLHGTRMAMAMVAPQNDWGTIGTWSAGRVVSVRATTAGESTFRPAFYQRGINRCLQYMADHQMRLAVINLSLGCGDCSLPTDEQIGLEDWVRRTHVNDVSVVAAAGNGGGSVEVPGSVPGTFTVAAGDSGGALCAYSSFGPEVALIAPGCPIQSADAATGIPGSYPGAGSSAAAAVASTLIAALRTLKPDATWQQAEGWVRDSARIVDGRRVLDGGAAARAAGLGDAVARAEAREPSPTMAEPASLTSAPSTQVTPATTEASPGPAARPTPTAAPSPRLAPPRIVSARFSRGRLTVRVVGRPSRARLSVTAVRLERDGIRARSRRHVVRRAGRLSIRTRWRPGRLQVTFQPADNADDRLPSRGVLLYRHGNRFR